MLYITDRTTLSLSSTTVTTTIQEASDNILDEKIVRTFTLPSSSSNQYRIKKGKIYLNMYIDLALNNPNLICVFTLNNIRSTEVTLNDLLVKLYTASITISDDIIVSSPLELNVLVKSSSTLTTDAVTVHYDKTNASKLIFVDTVAPLYHQVFNPIGTIIMYAGKITPPEGYLFCDGASYLINPTNIYYPLYLVISTIYGSSGSGETLRFLVPNLISKFPLGAASTSTLLSPQSTTTGGSFTIATTNMPAHRHSILNGITSVEAFSRTLAYTLGSGSTTIRPFTSVVSETIDASFTGGGNAYYQPYTTVNYIIKY
jgi:microcystin-dependent protein